MRRFSLGSNRAPQSKVTRKSPSSAARLPEVLEPRRLFTAGPTITLTAPVAVGSGITGANAQFAFTRTGSTAKPIVIYYSASGTITPHEYTKLSGVVTIHGGQTVAYVDVKPTVGLTVATNPTLTLDLIQKKTYRRGSPHVATITVSENNGGSGGGGTGGGGTGGGSTGGGGTSTSITPLVAGEQYQVPIDINSGSYARTDEPVDNSVNFTTAISSASGSGAFNPNSIRVAEVDGSGNVLNASVPFQFNQASGFNATTNASGDLIIQLSGATAANVTRHYVVQFATGGSIAAATVTPEVSTTTVTDNVGLSSYKIANSTAQYVMQRSTGGISEILDTNGNDWVGFNSSGGSAGEYRGVPNLGIPSGLHPYDPSGNFPSSGAANTATTTIVNSGPLETTIDVDSTDNNVHVVYRFYNNFVQATVVQANETNSNGNNNYWFLYEGTPGGSFSTGDKLVTSDGANQTLDQSYDAPSGIGSGNATTGQWASFQSQSENRFIYFAQNTQDTTEDSYYDLNNQMTVFGFGRTSPSSNPSQQQELNGSNTFTFGIANGNASAATTINGQYRAVTATTGSTSTI